MVPSLRKPLTELRRTVSWPDVLVGLLAVLFFGWLLVRTPSGGLHLSSRDLDYLVRTTIGEAAREPIEGQIAVISVILNRLRQPHYQWKNVYEVVTAHGTHKGREVYQFEPWQTRAKELRAIKRSDSDYVRIEYLARGILSRKLLDPTSDFCKGKGAWYFLNARTVRRRHGTLPAFARREGLRIGNHTFFCWR